MNNVIESLHTHLEWAQKNDYKVLYCAPYGSWNYGVADGNSDVDSFMIVMPSLRELALGSGFLHNSEHVLPNNEHLIACDLRRFKNDLLKGDFRALEVATSLYFCRVNGNALTLCNPPFMDVLNQRIFYAYSLSTIASLERYNFHTFNRMEWEGSGDAKRAYNLCVRLFSCQNSMSNYINPFTLDYWQMEFAYNVKKGYCTPHNVYNLFSSVDFVKMRDECLDRMKDMKARKPVAELNRWVYSEFEKAYEAK